MTLLLGCIADDLTGATDLASMLVKRGMRTMQLIGVPDPWSDGKDLEISDAQAVVVALKSRNLSSSEAVQQSLVSLAWLRRKGARQFMFKYCSTFDSTDAGNIGPVTEALLNALETDFTLSCPAFPENGRTVYNGHLFVGERLLSDSPMRHHPLTPMTDSNLVDVLQRQSEGKVGLLPYAVVDQGPAVVREHIEKMRHQGVRQAIADALTDRHLISLGHAAEDLPLIAGGAGIAMGLPDNFRDSGLLGERGRASRMAQTRGPGAVLAGSCSAATLRQIEHFRRLHPAYALDVRALALGEDEVGRALHWARGQIDRAPILISSSAAPRIVTELQAEFGRARLGALVEQALASIALGLREAGVSRLIVAGGETAGAVVQTLGIKGLRIGPAIDPGVPWTTSIGDRPVALALKSGNFGGLDFFTRAFATLDQMASSRPPV